MKLQNKVLLIFALALILLIITAVAAFGNEASDKSMAKSWASGSSNISTFQTVSGNLIGNYNIEIVPNWFKNNAMWWGNDKISTEEFTNAIIYLIKIGVVS